MAGRIDLPELGGSSTERQFDLEAIEDEGPTRMNNLWHRRMSAQTSVMWYKHRTASLKVHVDGDRPRDLVLDPHLLDPAVTADAAEKWGDADHHRCRGSRSLSPSSSAHQRPPVVSKIDGGLTVGRFDVKTINSVSPSTLADDTVNDPENTIYLVDRPKEDKKRKRLTGPFTVESASPFTYLPFDSGDPKPQDLGAATGEDAERLLEALVGNPVCDSDGHIMLEVAEIAAWPNGQLVTHEADCTSPGLQSTLTAAVMLASPDVTVTADQIAAAAAEARRGSSDITDLIVVASAFDNNAGHAAGAVTVHKVVTARDLQIEALAGGPDAGALTLLGEPDVACDITDDGQIVVTLDGYDTYDPATGTVRPSQGKDVDCWMIDTDHTAPRSSAPRLPPRTQTRART